MARLIVCDNCKESASMHIVLGLNSRTQRQVDICRRLNCALTLVERYWRANKVEPVSEKEVRKV